MNRSVTILDDRPASSRFRTRARQTRSGSGAPSQFGVLRRNAETCNLILARAAAMADESGLRPSISISPLEIRIAICVPR